MRLHVLSAGLLTPVGLSAAQTTVALRGGISAYAETGFTLSGSRWVPIVGATVPLRPAPKRGSERARLRALAVLALEECLQRTDLQPTETALLLGIREPHRHDPSVREQDSQLLAAIQEQLGQRFHAESRLLPLGNAAVYEALQIA